MGGFTDEDALAFPNMMQEIESEGEQKIRLTIITLATFRGRCHPQQTGNGNGPRQQLLNAVADALATEEDTVRALRNRTNQSYDLGRKAEFQQLL